jgi:hypothetical protein
MTYWIANNCYNICKILIEWEFLRSGNIVSTARKRNSDRITTTYSQQTIEVSKKIDGTPSKIQFSSIPINSSFYTQTTKLSKQPSWTVGRQPLISKLSNTERAETKRMWSQHDGNMQLRGKPSPLLRGVPIEYYKIIISVIFNKNFNNLKPYYDKLKN